MGGVSSSGGNASCSAHLCHTCTRSAVLLHLMMAAAAAAAGGAVVVTCDSPSLHAFVCPVLLFLCWPLFKLLLTNIRLEKCFFN